MTTTPAKLAANLANAQLSCGPKSSEGKAAVARNALRHGLSSGVLTVLPNENPADLEQITADINGEFKPATKAEQYYADQMIRARWKLFRIRRLEAEALDRIVEKGEEPPNIDRDLLATLETRGNILDKLDRYAAAAERAYSKAVRDLAQLRAGAQKAEIQNKAKEAQDWLKAELAKIENEPLPDPFADVNGPPSIEMLLTPPPRPGLRILKALAAGALPPEDGAPGE